MKFSEKKFVKLSLLLIITIITAMIATGCGGKQADKKEAKEEIIKLGVSTILSGPVAFPGGGGRDATRAYFNYLNEEHGGLNGRKVEVIVEDNRYEPDGAVAAANKLIKLDNVLAMPISFGTVTTQAIEKIVEREGIPALSVGSATALFNPPREHIFVVGTPYSYLAALAVEYIAKDLDEKNARLVLIYQEDVMGEDFVKGVSDAAEFFDLELVGTIPSPRGATDLSSQVAVALKQKPDYILAGTAVADTASILREIYKAGVKDEIKVVGTGASIYRSIIDLAGPEAADGFVGVKDAVTWGEDIPGIQFMRKIAEKDTPEQVEKENEYYIKSWINSIIMAEAIKNAGDDVTSERVTRELEKLNKFDPDGLQGPVTFGPNNRISSNAGRLYKLDSKKNEIIAISDWRVPMVYKEK